MATAETFALKCALCRQDFNKLYVLVCNHKICEQCYYTRKKGGNVVECPILSCSISSDAKMVKERDYKTFTDSLISMNEKSVLHSVEEYQTVLDDQEVNLAWQIEKIEKEINKTSESVDENCEELNKLHVKRQKELKEHFAKLKDNMIEMGVKRKEQLNNILSLINELKDLLQKQRKWFGEIIKKNAQNLDLRSLQEDIENNLKGIDNVDIDISKIDIRIIPEEKWIIKDDLIFSAPDCTINRQKLKMMPSLVLGFLTLSSKTLVKAGRMSLPDEPSSVCVLNDMVYCANQSTDITITNTSLTDKRYIEAGDMGNVTVVAPLPDCTLVVAATHGLYHITTEGTRLKQVAEGEHEQVRSRDSNVGAMSGSGDDKPRAIKLYTYNDKQFIITKLVQLPFTSVYDITIGLGHDVIYLASKDEHCIYVLSLDGTVLTKHGRLGRGGGGELFNPRAAATDAQDNLLVCDWYNDRLQVLSREGEWRLLQSDEGIEYPMDAVVVDGKVFVVGGGCFMSPYLGVFDISK